MVPRATNWLTGTHVERITLRCICGSELTRVCTNKDCKKTHLKFTRKNEEKLLSQTPPKKTPKVDANTPNSRQKPKKGKKTEG